MDRDQARAAFDDYVSAYDPANPRIALKVDHTLRVAELCARIAREQGLDAADCDCAWLLGLLHDIGRFEQVRRFDSFDDRLVGHAELGVQVLFDEPSDAGAPPLVRHFACSDADDELIRQAVGLHSGYELPCHLDARTRLFCDILRDADKIDIINVNCLCPIEDIYGMSEERMRASEVSPACVDIFYQHRCLPRGVREHPADIMLGHICLVWGLALPQSVAIMREQGQLRRMLERRWDVPATAQAFAAMTDHLRRELAL